MTFQNSLTIYFNLGIKHLITTHHNSETKYYRSPQSIEILN